MLKHTTKLAFSRAFGGRCCESTPVDAAAATAAPPPPEGEETAADRHEPHHVQT
ncbi:unnamed protein product [Gongylonema pulchrum]|uniref:Secreted protein n=1 Tax=Gongylonema pulchrum TaxID=637853 RepID=A0A183EW31_9BILA|nr:unnamed protein product [Gongylonema pulchrum]